MKSIVNFTSMLLASLIIAFVLFTEAHSSTTYATKCISCHNKDPRKPGAIGPDIAFSGYALVKLKTQDRSYPPGYTPKRKTKIMPRILLNETQIKEIVDYLNSFKPLQNVSR